MVVLKGLYNATALCDFLLLDGQMPVLAPLSLKRRKLSHALPFLEKREPYFVDLGDGLKPSEKIPGKHFFRIVSSQRTVELSKTMYARSP